MTRTEDLIAALARDARPVRRLRGPWTRAFLWLGLAALAIGGILAVDGICPNLESRLADPLFVTGLAAAALTGVLAGAGAFLVGLPDRSRLWVWLPMPAVVVWFGAVGLECLGHWTPVPEGMLQARDAAHCLCVFAAVSALLAASLLWMLRPAPLADGRGAAWLAGLAVAGLGTTGFTLTRTFEESALLLTWNLGAGLLAALLLAGWRIGGWRMGLGRRLA